MEPSYKKIENSFFASKNDTLQKSYHIGNRFLHNEDCQAFDDMILYKQVPRFKIFQITLYSDKHEKLTGFQIIYYNQEKKEFFAGADNNLCKKHDLNKKSIDLKNNIINIFRNDLNTFTGSFEMKTDDNNA